ncbi:PDDEXK-like [Arabidopsis suecica]|uniref:PDDEXK-like n=1 Tax=Arabidopsis suecica TaxID=45249 RepID=A0A8T2BBG2_ARASU|nr:PDDEXK-like [Arabidopsis suecica]
MAISRTKRVTDPLDDEAKARIFSSHGCILDQDSPRLYELVHGYFEDGHEETLYDSDSDLSENSVVERPCEDSEEVLKMAVSFSDSDHYRNLLLAHVLRAVEVYSGFRSRNKSVFRDKVASFLRELGHNAAVCVSKWTSSAKLIAGSYHFIDVVYKPSDNDQTTVRYFVDLDFASEFEIARPTREYTRVLQLLPNVFVGKEENLRTIVRESCDAAKRSMKSRGLSLPPWRRSSYLQHKWFGSYKRKVGSSLGAKPLNSDAVSCRSLGFDDGAANTRLLIKT